MKTLLRLGAGLMVIGGAMMLYAWGGERPRMSIQHYGLSLPDGVGAGLRILHLSDQHFGADGWVRRSRLQRMRKLLSGIEPDVILLTGDFLHNDTGLDAVEEMLLMLPPAPLGCFAVLGNHDYAEYSYQTLFRNAWREISAPDSRRSYHETAWRELKQMSSLFWNIYRNDRIRFAALPNETDELRALLALYDVQMCENTACALPDYPDIWLAGVDDLVEGEPDLEQALAPVPADATIILLTHNPDLAYDSRARRVALALSGHTHGGQVVLPWLGAVHTQGTMLPRDHPAGYFDDLPGGGQMVVSRGMGESTPLRFHCLPEIVIIDLLAE
jgi:uncharacterized protein